MTTTWKIKSAYEYGPFDYWVKGIYTEEGKKAHDRMANAAPDLLKACQLALDSADDELKIVLRAAIDKATKE